MKKALGSLAAILLLLSATTAEAADPEKARRKLAKEEVEFTPEAFLKKVFLGDEDIVQLFLEAGMPVDTADEKGWSALHRAAQGDSQKTLAVILKAKPALNGKTKEGDTPLCRAAASGPAKHVSLLLDAGADANAVCSFGNTALHEAAREDDAAKVSALVAAGARVEARNDRQQTPLHLAANKTTAAAAIALLRAKADVNARTKSGRTPLHEATSGDDPAVVEALLQAGATVDARDSSDHTALYEAAAYGRLRIIPMLLAAGADPRAKSRGGETPLKAAQEDGKAEVIDMLKNAKPVAAATAARAETAAKPGKDAAPLPSSAAASEELKKMGLRPGKQTLFERVEGRDVRAVTLIVASGVSPDSRNEQGRTPLYVAVEAGGEDVVKTLLAAGANPNDPGANVVKSMEYGDTLVMRAVDRGNPEILKALVAAGSNVNKGNAYGVNGLMSAAMQGRAEMVEILVKAGSNVNAKDKNGTPVLYSAVQGGNADVVRILIDAGADVSASRKLLMDTAREKKNPQIVELLARPPAKTRKAASGKSDYVQSDVAAPPVQPAAPKPVSTGTGKKPVGARQAYDLTFAVTSKWRTDAGLTELSTTSEGPLDGEGRSAHWVAHYYSPSAKQVYLTSFDEGKITHSAHPSNELKTVPVDADTILDSKRLLEIAEEAGGSAYSARGALLTLGLVPNRGRALWYFNYSDKATSKNVATIVINANGGKVELKDLK